VKLRNFVLFGLIAVLAGMLLIGASFLPLGNRQQPVQLFVIPKGTSLNQIAISLKNQDLILSATLFKWTASLLGKRTTLKSGEYRVEGPISHYGLIEMLSEGRTLRYKITIPEGLRMTEIFALLETKGIGSQKNYLTYARQPKSLAGYGLKEPVPTLEGFLYPETYYFSRDMAETTVISSLIKAFFDHIPKDFELKAQRVGLTFYQAIILASIIEKETAVPKERKLIASVFHNRLKRNMKLQTDPTVIYGIEHFDGNLTRKQLRQATPYNTYLKTGLPPTPIANPGIDALMAAVEPVKTEFLYFVAKGDGTHHFTRTYREHHQAVSFYQKRPRADYRSY